MSRRRGEGKAMVEATVIKTDISELIDSSACN